MWVSSWAFKLFFKTANGHQNSGAFEHYYQDTKKALLMRLVSRKTMLCF